MLCFVFFSCRTVSFRSRILPPNSVWMEDAKMKGLEICHPQVSHNPLTGLKMYHFDEVFNVFGVFSLCLVCV